MILLRIFFSSCFSALNIATNTFCAVSSSRAHTHTKHNEQTRSVQIEFSNREIECDFVKCALQWFFLASLLFALLWCVRFCVCCIDSNVRSGPFVCVQSISLPAVPACQRYPARVLRGPACACV